MQVQTPADEVSVPSRLAEVALSEEAHYAYRAVDDVLGEVYRRRRKFVIRSSHEGYTLILRELDELWDKLRKIPVDQLDDYRILREDAKRVAAAALCFMIDQTQKGRHQGD